jgi:hypothetical protein
MRLGEFETTAEGGLRRYVQGRTIEVDPGGFGNAALALPDIGEFIRALHAAHERGEVAVGRAPDEWAKLKAENAALRAALVRIHNSGASAWAAQVALDTLRVPSSELLRHEGDAVKYMAVKFPQPTDEAMRVSGFGLGVTETGDEECCVSGSVECRIDNPEVVKAWREGQASLVAAIEGLAAALREAMPKETK